MTDEPTAEDVGRMLIELAPQVSHAIRHRLRWLEPALTYRQYIVLQQLGAGPLSLSALRLRATVGLSSLSQTTDSLVRRGLVVRSPGRLDRREIELELSASGRALARAAEASLAELALSLTEALPERGRAGLARSLRTLMGGADELLHRDHDRRT